ncbi:hypothetical protein M440DRAFT_1462539 [Trichoderma longibrachiatum ATCC 18648]|uniref:Uncharacterized protein n=1 Tax=Trichoderma longibrachiatum ATCC 18648 TaxID=983965 RepID=A0A2T4C502_TRILO|nr:hypothetical protein M440DRAFT_1462539 [Trichoderma longibrachiatum ATCC 18648]
MTKRRGVCLSACLFVCLSVCLSPWVVRFSLVVVCFALLVKLRKDSHRRPSPCSTTPTTWACRPSAMLSRGRADDAKTARSPSPKTTLPFNSIQRPDSTQFSRPIIVPDLLFVQEQQQQQQQQQ